MLSPFSYTSQALPSVYFCNALSRYNSLAPSGYEKQFVANHLGHFHLVNRLLGVMDACSSSKRARHLLLQSLTPRNFTPNVTIPHCFQINRA